jgi:2-oxoglutarate dehydrogenase E1 component
VQEEPENMGAWSFVHRRLIEVAGTARTVDHVSRAESGSPATGSHAIHVQEQNQVIDGALA